MANYLVPLLTHLFVKWLIGPFFGYQCQHSLTKSQIKSMAQSSNVDFKF